MRDLDTARSFLFAPGTDARKLAKALLSDADAVIADLEDAVRPEAKERARATIASVFSETEVRMLRLVRVNAASTPWLDADLSAAAAMGVDGLVLPKALPEDVERVARATRVPVIALVETADALERCADLARTKGIVALMLGAVDLALELGLEPLDDGSHLLYSRSRMTVAAAAAGLRGSIDQVWVATRDQDGLQNDALRARALGFRGKACVHPAQVASVNQIFSPSPDDVERARAVVAAFEAAAAQGRGAVALDDEMIDLPVVERARRVLAAAERSTEE